MARDKYVKILNLTAILAALVIDLSLPQMHFGFLVAAKVLLTSRASFKQSFLSHAQETVSGHGNSFVTTLSRWQTV